MSYLKSTLVGVLGAVAFVMLWTVATVVVPIATTFLRAPGGGSGGVGFVTASSGPVFVMALAGFVAGFYWHRRRQNRAARF